MAYLCPRCKGAEGRGCFLCLGTGYYELDGGKEGAWARESILQLHLQLDVALADVETMKRKYLEAVEALPEDLRIAPGSLAEAIGKLVIRVEK